MTRLSTIGRAAIVALAMTVMCLCAVGWSAPPPGMPRLPVGQAETAIGTEGIDVNQVRAWLWSPGFLSGMVYPTRSEGPFGASRVNRYLDMAFPVFGCVRGMDTLISGWVYPGHWIQSFAPLRKRTNNPESPFYDPQCPYDLEIYDVSDDTYVSPYDRYPPIGIEIHQTTRAWKEGCVSRAIFVDNWIVNIGVEPIVHGTVGVDASAWVFNTFIQKMRVEDHDVDSGTICGFIRTAPGAIAGAIDTLNLVWFAEADCDIDRTRGKFTSLSPTAVLGIRVLRAPRSARFSFNWWGHFLSWGPHKRASEAVGVSANGTYEDAASLYRIMTGGELDYDQVYAARDLTADGWGPPPDGPLARDIADGTQPEVMLSVGPFDEPILPGDSVLFSYVVVMGDDFHTDPANYPLHFDYDNPSPYIDRLNFANLISTARWAEWFYDNPGVDTDGDWYAGEFYLTDCNGRDCDSVYYTGDGVPDFKGPLPPPAPPFDIQSFPGKLVVRWTGAETELARDRHSRLPDFEGYRVYIAHGDSAETWRPLADWDREDFIRYSYSEVKESWPQSSPPYTLAEWRAILRDPAFDPHAHAGPSFVSGYRDVAVDTIRTIDGTIVDIFEHERISYFAPQAANHGNSYREPERMAPNLIQQVAVVDTAVAGEARQYGVYEFTIDDLSQARPYWIAVTTYDYGDYRNYIEPEESRPADNAMPFFAVNSVDVVEDSNLRVIVYPNPYKIEFRDAHGQVATYHSQGYESSPGAKFDERDRRVWFTNLPDTADISIYSLDGDLIRRILHPDPFLTRYPSVVGWDLISRNTQAVSSGIYIWHVASRLGQQVGKLVIIK